MKPKIDSNGVAWCDGYRCEWYRSAQSGWGLCHHQTSKQQVAVVVGQQCYPHSVTEHEELVKLRSR